MTATIPKGRQQMSASASAPERDRYHHGDLPAALKRAAVSLIARNGVEGFSLREAAMAIGVSPSAAYRHFEDKSALLGALAADAFVDLQRHFEQAMQAVPGSSARAASARFVALGRAYVAFAQAQPERFMVMFGPHAPGMSRLDPCAKAEHHDGPYASLSRVLDELSVTGVMSPRRREGAELLAWSAIHGLATLLVSKVLTPQPGGVAPMVDRICQDCLRAMSTPR